MVGEAVPGGLATLRAKAAKRQHQYVGWEDLIPPANVDFDEWRTEPTPVFVRGDAPDGHALVKAAQLSAEFADAPLLHWLHGFLIAMARRTPVPDRVTALFHRLWEEETTYLLETLDYRWQISAAATFRDIGRSEAQRRAGMALALLFNILKLSDSERAMMGHTPQVSILKHRTPKALLTLDQSVFALHRGDLDTNVLLYVWEACDAADGPLRSLALHLMEVLNQDDRSLFHRLTKLRAEH